MEVVKFPGTVHFSFGPILNEGNYGPVQNTPMPVCLLVRHKWALTMRLSVSMLISATFLTSAYSGRQVLGLENRIQEFGKFLYKEDYLGAYVRSYSKEHEYFDVTYAWYGYVWEHGEGCTKEHPYKEEYREAFPDVGAKLYWAIDFARCL